MDKATNIKVKQYLCEIRDKDPDSFSRFSLEHNVCFTEGYGDWLFPALYEFYTIEIKNPSITKLVISLGMLLHTEAQRIPMHELTSLDRSLCLDESTVWSYILDLQRYNGTNLDYKELKNPYKTRKSYVAMNQISSQYLDALVIKYGGYANPYILADLAGIYINSYDFMTSIGYLRRSMNQLIEFPNKYWNSELALTGAINTLRWIRLMSYDVDVNISRKIFKYNYLYLSRLACIARNELLEQSAYVNRAALVMEPMAYLFLPYLGQNPECLYISDLYYAHFCNQTATEASVISNNNYYRQSRTYYQNASLWPNDSGGYADIEDESYGDLVERKHKVAVLNAWAYLKELRQGKDKLTICDLNNIFETIETSCKKESSVFRDKVLHYKKY